MSERIWTEEKFKFRRHFYQFHDCPLKPKPLVLPGRPLPEIFQGGNSDDARENAAVVSDCYFISGNTLEGFCSQITDVDEKTKKQGREGQVSLRNLAAKSSRSGGSSRSAAGALMKNSRLRGPAMWARCASRHCSA